MVIIYVKLLLNRTSKYEVMGRTRLCWKVMLWPWPSKRDPNVLRDMLSQYDNHLYKKCKIWLQITKLWAGHNFAVRSCCDLDLQGSNLNVALDTSSQYGDHSCEIVFKSTSNNKVKWAGNNFAERSPWPSNFAHDTSCQYGVLWNNFEIRLQIAKLWAGHEWDVQTDCRTDGQGGDYMLPPPKFFGEHN